MSVSQMPDTDGLTDAAPAPRHVRRSRVAAKLREEKLLLAASAFVAIIAIAAILAPLIAPYQPNEAFSGLRLAPPGTQGHLLGADAQSRDILTRLIWGGRTSLLSSVVPVVFAVIASLILGLVAGYSRGWAADAIMRVVDVAFSFPMVLVAIGLATAVGPSLMAVGVSVFLAATPYLTRVVFSEVKAERDKEYIYAALALGASRFEILFRELLPNVATSAVIYGTTMVGGMIAFAAGLSFLGLGVQPPEADWGRMAAEGAKVLILGAPHVAALPALMIAAVALAFNWIGDGLRNLLDPRR